jgi:hypothetical protein
MKVMPICGSGGGSKQDREILRIDSFKVEIVGLRIALVAVLDALSGSAVCVSGLRSEERRKRSGQSSHFEDLVERED